MPRGGYYPHAKRWGRKSKWLSNSPTVVIRVPESIAEQVIELAHRIDQGETIAFDTKSENTLFDESIAFVSEANTEDMASVTKAEQPKQVELEPVERSQAELASFEALRHFWNLEERRKKYPEEIYKQESFANYLGCTRPVINSLINKGHSEFRHRTKHMSREYLKRVEVWDYSDDYDQKQGRRFYLVGREERFAQLLKRIED